jgi:hypothetical protein
VPPGPPITPDSHPPLEHHRYERECWWCGDEADSREHRHKASDLRREFSSEEYKAGDIALFRSGEQVGVDLRGPNAKIAKFGSNFCARCNNERSQPFDRAYDRFIEWFLANETAIEDSGLIPLVEIFDDWEEGQGLVLSYYAKHVGCRIADLDYRVPDPLRAFLDGRSEPSGFAFNFEISGMLAGINAILKENPTAQGTSGNLMLGDVNARVTREGRHPTELGSWISYHALQVFWEWKTEYPRSWTNLVGPVAQLPRIEPEAREGLLRASRQAPPEGT